MGAALPSLSGHAQWIERMRETSVPDVAKELGLQVMPPRGSSGGTIYGCPVCNAVTRHRKTKDKRGAIGIRNDLHGWRCFQCDTSGDALDLVAVVLRGAKLAGLGQPGKDEVREWCSRFHGLTGTAEKSIRLGHRPARLAPEPAKPEKPHYPPASEVAALWGLCGPVMEDMPATAWLKSRGLDPCAIAEQDLARVLPCNVQVPTWACYQRQPWWRHGMRLIVPMVDARGVVRSVLARRIEGEGDRKSLAATGFERRGLLMACPLARQVLETGTLPQWWNLGPPFRMWIAEGEVDFITAATSWANTESDATLAMVQGGWLPEHAERIPNGTDVIIATDADEEGDKYAERISATLAERWRSQRVEVKRWKPRRI